MPYPQSPRPGLRHVQSTGEDWQAEKLDDLAKTFGQASVVGDQYTTQENQIRFREIDLGQRLPGAAAISFIVEAKFDIRPRGAFETALGIAGHRNQFQLAFSDLRPDIVEVLNPGTFPTGIAPDGRTRPHSSKRSA